MNRLGLDTYKEGEYNAFNSSGIEEEVGELLYSFVRVLRPNMVLETGTARGISSAYIGLALKENHNGHLDTIEFDHNHWKEAESLWNRLEILSYISQIKYKVEDFKLDNSEVVQYDLIFLDSEPEYRFGELVRFYPYLKPGGYIFIHDLPRGFCKGNINLEHPEFKNWPYGEVPKELENWLKDRDLVKFHFGTNRELCGFYKKDSRDYNA